MFGLTPARIGLGEAVLQTADGGEGRQGKVGDVVILRGVAGLPNGGGRQGQEGQGRAERLPV
ncbi:MAG TPA: hypothetical protein VF086_07150 [Propionibacteriaceae bacterium]